MQFHKDEQPEFLSLEIEFESHQALEVYQLPTDIKAKVNELYERDVLRMGGSSAGMESEYRSFLKVGGGRWRSVEGQLRRAVEEVGCS